MPNTLVHLGLQGLGNRLLVKRVDLKWVFLGCIIPDLPWITRRAIIGFNLNLDLYDLRLYSVVQASLLFCLILAAALALTSEKPRTVFIILAANVLVHLLLDSIEIKWGNGVHLLAPLSWEYLSLELIWPDSVLIAFLSVLGLAACVWFLCRPGSTSIRLSFRSDTRWDAITLLVLIYAIGPLYLLEGPYSSNINSIATLKERDLRPGKEIRMDRESYRQHDKGDVVVTFAGESLRVEGKVRAEKSTQVSLIGEFLDVDTIHIDRLHEYRSPWRDLASYVGLGIFALSWSISLVREQRGS